MEESQAEQVVELLRERNVFASVSRRTGVYGVGVRVVIPDGREALWDNDGAAGLEAMVLRNGVLVGFVPKIPDSDDLSAEQVASIIAAADYDQPVVTKPSTARPAAMQPAARQPAASRPAATGDVSAAEAQQPRRRWGLLRRR